MLSSKLRQLLQLRSKGVREEKPKRRFTTAWRKHFDLLDVSHQINHTSLENLTTLGPHADAKISADAGSMSITVHKIQSPIYLDYKPAIFGDL